MTALDILLLLPLGIGAVKGYRRGLVLEVVSLLAFVLAVVGGLSLLSAAVPLVRHYVGSAFGMLPLVVIPGAGAEIYRGLGAVIVGGILISHIFTLILIPAMLRLGESSSIQGEEPAEEPLPRSKPRALRAAAE